METQGANERKKSVARICLGPPVSVPTTWHMGQTPRSLREVWTVSASSSTAGGTLGVVTICMFGWTAVGGPSFSLFT